MKRKQEDADEVKDFKQAIAARNALPLNPPLVVASSAPASVTSSSAKGKLSQSAGPKKSGKIALKGVVVKRKKSSVPSTAQEPVKDARKDGDAVKESETAGGPSKRRRVSSPAS